MGQECFLRQQRSGKSSLPRRRAPVKHRNAKALANSEPHKFIRGSSQVGETFQYQRLPEFKNFLIKLIFKLFTVVSGSITLHLY